MTTKTYAPMSPRVPFKSRLALDLFRAVYMDRAHLSAASAMDELILRLDKGLRYNMGLDAFQRQGKLTLQISTDLRGGNLFREVTFLASLWLDGVVEQSWDRCRVEIMKMDPATGRGDVLTAFEASGHDDYTGMDACASTLNAHIAGDVLRHFADVTARHHDAPRPSLGVLLPIWRDALYTTGATLALSDECEDDVIVQAQDGKNRVYIYQLREASGPARSSVGYAGAEHTPTGRYTVSRDGAPPRSADCFEVIEAVTSRLNPGARR